MANITHLASRFVPMLDEAYRLASLTSVLDGAPELVGEGANAGELIVPMIEMDGLADYSRNSGYVDGDVTLTNETVKCNFDRGRMFTVDTADNEETAGLHFGMLAGEFIRTKVAPELDAFRLSTYANKAGGSETAQLATGEAVVEALRAAVNQMDEDEVPADQRHLFITPTLLGMVEDLDTTKSRRVLEQFASVNRVPQSRFCKTITLNDGSTAGQEKGGFTGSGSINFMIVHKPALIQFQKHVAPKVIRPAENQSGDAWKFGYRNYGVADVYANKLAGVYAHFAQ